MTIIIAIICFLIFVKLLLFWLWLWQLKEYHLGRLRAHFEMQAVKKIVSGFWWLKYPKFTKKIIVILFTAVFLAVLMLFKGFYLAIFLLIILVPLFFQIPTVIWRKIVIEKAKQKRAKFKDLLVIGITGSYGKTSTKEFLAEILSKKYKVLKTKEHQNSEIGIARCILNNLKPEHEVFVVEMGAYNRGGIKLLCSIVKPKIGILTGINEQHMSTFGSQENIIKTKFELIESLPADGMAFFNGKNKYCLELYQRTNIKKKIYGEDVKMAGLENIEAAKAVAEELGISYVEVRLQQPGMKLKKGINGLNIIDATYSANPDGVIAHLEYLKNWLGQPFDKFRVKKIIVMPCLIELGRASKEVHRRIGRKINEVCDLAIITTADRFKEIKEVAPEALLIENPKEIIGKIKSFCSPGDIVLLESRVPVQIIKQLI